MRLKHNKKVDSAALTKCNNKMGSVKGVLVIKDSYWVKVPKLQENKTANKKIILNESFHTDASGVSGPASGPLSH